MTDTTEQIPERTRVLNEAIVQCATKLKIPSADLAEILHIDNLTSINLIKQKYLISDNTESWTLAVNLVRVYRSLSVMVGGNERHAISWMYSPNDGLNKQSPISYIKKGNLVKVCEYLESHTNF